ncbi:uncharacterized protein FIBRA_06330 [Fibroporia radiculosa]|uniref:Uncharacterized protein n=1 Tax=Fibroporia radiculosa TaxID=599839 RepID=J4GB61_9APHY|nr:uncharacterized protein FIBRA_06330 [Fibroporia radiculosa]CCM04168.1 predicted protein [Fibroporia radiculosa]
MSFFPYSRLLLGPSQSVVVSGPHIEVIDSQNGELIYSTVNLGEAEKASLLKSGPIRCAAVDEAYTHVATAGEDKKLKVWQTDGLKLLSERELPKKPTSINFTQDGQTILVSDKFGDIFSYPLHPNISPSSTTESHTDGSKRGALTSHENPSDGELVLGHVSLLTCFLLSSDEKYIITADRDEHIRISWYPQGYVIESYCLGHARYVSAIHIPSFAQSILVSGGGDPMLKLWNWMTGGLLSEIPIMEAVESFIKVRAPSRRRGQGDDDELDGTDGAGNNTKRHKKRGKKGKGQKEETKAMEGTPDTDGGDDRMEGGEGKVIRQGSSPPIEQAAAETNATDGPDRLVLVIHKLESLDLGDRRRYLIFSAVGATALFYCKFPESDETSPPSVHALDFGSPVTDFTFGAHNTIWVSLDSSQALEEHISERGDAFPKAHLVELVTWVSDMPVIVSESDAPPLLSSLRTTCVIPASPADLKVLDIYSALSSMPKNIDPEHDPLKRDVLAEADADIEGPPGPSAGNDTKGKGKGKGKGAQKKELSQREVARLKKKRAVAERLQEHEKSAGQTQSPADVAASPGVGEQERGHKRARSDTDIVPQSAGSEVQDAMDES